MNIRCELDSNKVTMRNQNIQRRLTNVVIQASQSDVETLPFMAQHFSKQEENRNHIPKETMEKIQKKTKEEWGDYLKLKKLNEGRMEKVLAPAYDPLKCPCNRPTKSVFCVGCGYFGKGRKYVPCNKHSQNTYLTDIEFCPVCRSANYLVEKDIPSVQQDRSSEKNISPILEQLRRCKYN